MLLMLRRQLRRDDGCLASRGAAACCLGREQFPSSWGFFLLMWSDGNRRPPSYLSEKGALLVAMAPAWLAGCHRIPYTNPPWAPHLSFSTDSSVFT